MRYAALVLEDGTTYEGRTAGAPGIGAGEASVSTGHAEAATDPSYAAQILAFSRPPTGGESVSAGLASSSIPTFF